MSVTRLNTPARLAVEGEVYKLGQVPETGFQRVRRLQTEARLLAREEVEILCREMTALAARAAEIAVGGDAFPVGVREMASRLAADLPEKAQGMQMIAERMTQNR
jgi:hypothetical protein